MNTRTARLALVVIAALALSACASDAEPEPQVPSPPPAIPSDPVPLTSPTPDADTGEDEFCALVAPQLRPAPREYIGSDEHVAAFRALIAAAPDHLVDPLTEHTDYFDNHVSPADPPSQDFANFPPHIQELALQLDRDLRAQCS